MNVMENHEYFEWLCNVVNAGVEGPFYSYKKLLVRLAQTPYTPSTEYDQDRANDGISLRYSFNNYPNDYIGYGLNVSPYHSREVVDDHIDRGPCSMLEMMISFANKINSRYLYSAQYDRTFVWFWMMIESLGLARYDDMHFDDTDIYSDVDFILEEFNNYSMTCEEGIWYLNVSLFKLPKEYLVVKGHTSLWDKMNLWYALDPQRLESIDPYEYVEYFFIEYGNSYL